MLTVKKLIAKLANNASKMNMNEFFGVIHSKFYSDQNIDFMEYFLELTEHEDEFYVHHEKLVEYGIMTSTESSDVRKKLKSLDLKNEVDYHVGDVSEQLPSGTKHKKVYILTPDAFKKCLMRAQRRPNQPVDPVIYCDYYLLLEKVYKFYTDYERQFADRLLLVKDDKIDGLSKQIDNLTTASDKLLVMNDNLTEMNKEQSTKIDNLTEMNTEQSLEIKELLGYGKDSKQKVEKLTIEVGTLNEKVDNLNDKIDNMFNFAVSFAKMTIPMWIGSTIIKTQFDNLTEHNDENYGLLHLKIMFSVAFYDLLDTPEEIIQDGKSIIVRAHMKQYFCCTNFADVGARIRILYQRHKHNMLMLQPKAISLISCEINTERNVLEEMTNFPDNVIAQYSKKHKSFDLHISEDTFEGVSGIYNAIIDNAKNERFQPYQIRMDKLKRSEREVINDKIIDRITSTDEEFFEGTLPYCQRYINCYLDTTLDTNRNTIGYKYTMASRKTYCHDGLMVTQRVRYLRFILSEINYYVKNDPVDAMLRDGIISKNDLNMMKCIAKIENFDTSNIEFPEEE